MVLHRCANIPRAWLRVGAAVLHTSFCSTPQGWGLGQDGETAADSQASTSSLTNPIYLTPQAPSTVYVGHMQK